MRPAALVAIALPTVLASAAPAGQPAWPYDDAAKVMFGDRGAPASCARDDDPIACTIRSRYAADAKAAASALSLYATNESLAGIGADEVMDGGYRGKIHLVPQLPVAGYRRHVAWVAWAMASIDAFFAAQFEDHAPRYRWRHLAFRFVRSVGKHTPSAYASGWSIVYNVDGSLMTSDTAVRETLFHELFHLNDEAHGDWSSKHLTHDYEAILAKCRKLTVRCLAPFAPNDTVVRGGTYYAFQQDNGKSVHEYAAELAVRYFKEQSEMRARGKLAKRAFKCGPPENARSWQALVDEFFGGRDDVPACT
jgi:hypothetical protein